MQRQNEWPCSKDSAAQKTQSMVERHPISSEPTTSLLDFLFELPELVTIRPILPCRLLICRRHEFVFGIPHIHYSRTTGTHSPNNVPSPFPTPFLCLRNGLLSPFFTLFHQSDAARERGKWRESRHCSPARILFIPRKRRRKKEYERHSWEMGYASCLNERNVERLTGF